MTVAATRDAVARLGAWVAGLRWSDVPEPARERLRLVLLDALGVTVVGARQVDQRALVAAWHPPPGPAPLVGAGRLSTVDAAAWLNATALVRLELDEGHKYAKGHPGAHLLPAVLALAADLGASGPDTMTALLAGYEVAARFGRATTLRPGMHPHGSWGVAGAAAGCARLLGLPPDRVAAAIDAGGGLPVAGHFGTALDGNPVRDAWIAASNVSGLAAARMAAAGVARNTGTPALALGEVLGHFDPTAITDGLSERWDVELGYFKRHASCSFTHPAADAALLAGVDRVDDIEEVVVETHSLAAGLDRAAWDTRLAAMFSTPFVVAAALIRGEVGPDVPLDDPVIAALAGKVVVRLADDLDARLPDERAARVTIRAGGASRVVEVPNPVGDSAHHPMDERDVVGLLHRLLDADTVHCVRDVVAELPGCPDAGPPLRRLAITEEEPCASTP